MGTDQRQTTPAGRMAVLRVYVTASCETCSIARALVDYVRRTRPHQAVELIDREQEDGVWPTYIFGTPTYCLEDRVIFLGNPSAPALLAALDEGCSA